jgi:hypothetical protein
VLRFQQGTRETVQIKARSSKKENEQNRKREKKIVNQANATVLFEFKSAPIRIETGIQELNFISILAVNLRSMMVVICLDVFFESKFEFKRGKEAEICTNLVEIGVNFNSPESSIPPEKKVQRRCWLCEVERENVSLEGEREQNVSLEV